MRHMLIGAMVVVLGVFGAGCGKSSSTKSAAKGRKVEEYDFRFEPTTVSAKPGETVTLTLKNEGKREHNFSITSLGVSQDLEKDKSATVTFTAPSSAGDVQFFCKYHQASNNMVGTLHVA